MAKKVQVFTCGGQIISMFYEYREKQICSIHGDSTFQRLQISKETIHISVIEFKANLYGWMFHGWTQPHHKLSTITHNYHKHKKKSLSMSRNMCWNWKNIMNNLQQRKSADQTPVFLNMLRFTAINSTGEQQTILPHNDSYHSWQKLPYMVFKQKTIAKEKFPQGIIVEFQQSIL